MPTGNCLLATLYCFKYVVYILDSLVQGLCLTVPAIATEATDGGEALKEPWESLLHMEQHTLMHRCLVSTEGACSSCHSCKLAASFSRCSSLADEERIK